MYMYQQILITVDSRYMYMYQQILMTVDRCTCINKSL